MFIYSEAKVYNNVTYFPFNLKTFHITYLLVWQTVRTNIIKCTLATILFGMANTVNIDVATKIKIIWETDSKWDKL